MNNKSAAVLNVRPNDLRTLEIAVQLKNIYHSYDYKFSNTFLTSSKSPNQENKDTFDNGEPHQDTNNNSQSQDIPLRNYQNTCAVHFRPQVASVNQNIQRQISEFSDADRRSSICMNTLPANVRDSNKLILRGLNLTIPKGCIYGLLGPSGCGKTTLLKCITGFLRPSYGTVRVFGTRPNSGRGHVPGRDLGYMPQDYSLHEDLTIEEMLFFFGRVYGLRTNVIKERVKELIALMNLPNKDRLVGNLSGGQKRRVSFVCSIIHIPKLLILDEPTVGCDPLLRERIWAHLTHFADTEKTTILITTHYIEEASRSHIVGFIKKGCLMAENKPENLYQIYETSSLERIFYKLCVTEKLRKGSKRDSNADKPLVKRSSSSQPIKSSEDLQKNFYFHNFTASNNAMSLDQIVANRPKSLKTKIADTIRHMNALNCKNTMQTLRKPEAIVAQFVIPLIVVMFFCVCIGSLPQSIPIGIFNEENCNQTDLCLSEDLVQALNSYAIKKIPVTNRTWAYEEVKKKQMLGFLHFGPNFSEGLIDRISFDSESKLVNDSVIVFTADRSNYLLINMFQQIFYEGYIRFVDYSLNKLDISPLLGKLPIRLEDPIFGNYTENDYSGINAYAGPGLIMIIVYSVSFALTGFSILVEKTNGMLERSRIAGVSASACLLSLAAVNMVLFSVGLFVLLQVATHLFDVPMRGSLFDAYGLLLLQSFAGLANGMFLTSITANISEYAVLGNGILLCMFILSGALWSVESMPFYVQWISYLLPVTIPIESLRSVLIRGLSITLPSVYHGFFMLIGWSIGMIIGAAILFDLRK